jgi:hypothetical protein
MRVRPGLLLEVFRPEDVLAGVREAIARGAVGFDAVEHLCRRPVADYSSAPYSFDAVKHLMLCRIERWPPICRAGHCGPGRQFESDGFTMTGCVVA